MTEASTEEKLSMRADPLQRSGHAPVCCYKQLGLGRGMGHGGFEEYLQSELVAEAGK